jgi:dienelactone hydrolase
LAALVLQVRVKPRAAISSLEQIADGTWVAKVKSPPVDGKANADGHGFNCDARGSFNAGQAQTARERTLDFFRKHLG